MASLFRSSSSRFLRTSGALLSTQNTRLPLYQNLLLRRNLSADVRRTIEGVLTTAPVVLFMKGTPETPKCGFSKASVQILGLQGVDPEKFAAVNVLEDEEVRQGIKEFSNWPTIPQLYVNKEFVGGCDILVAMHQSGELAELLEKEGVLVPAEETKKPEETKPEA